MVCSSPLSVALPHPSLLLLTSALFCGCSKSVCLWIAFTCHFGVVSLLPLSFVVGPVAKALLLQSYPCVGTDIVMRFADVNGLSILTPTTWAYSV